MFSSIKEGFAGQSLKNIYKLITCMLLHPAFCNHYPSSDGFGFHDLSELRVQGSVDPFPPAEKSSLTAVTPASLR